MSSVPRQPVRIGSTYRGQASASLVVGCLLSLALAGIAAATAATPIGRDVAAANTLIDLRPHWHFYDDRFPRGRVRTQRPGVGVLLFTSKSRRDHGRIACVLSMKHGKVRFYGCRWTVVVGTQAVYWGLAWITIYDPKLSGHNFELFWSKCRNKDASRFCKTHPPPRPG
jgi:hypothetical protein